MAEKTAHSVTIEAFMYPSEDRTKVAKAVSFVVPGAKIHDESVESYYGPPIIRMSAVIRKPKEVSAALDHIANGLSDEDRREVIGSINDRLDKEGNFYIRFSKQDAHDERLVVQYKGDVIKLVVKMVGYPYKRENAKKDLVKIFEKN
ncbi:hypothetical protein H0N95_00645 [Candidatus Micrarchaeota archaeon]|nr:hypothetical protein [Candidatus Micrarchaeota archaeon]